MKLKRAVLALLAATMTTSAVSAKSEMAMQNVQGRADKVSLNGKWAFLPDISDQGNSKWKSWGQSGQQKHPLDHIEVVYEGGAQVTVPGDWNSQRPEYLYLISPVWYQRTLDFKREGDKRSFLHFGAVCERAIVFLNGKEIGHHEGGYTPFQIEVTDLIKEGKNELVVRVDNRHNANTVPSERFDWWPYGGITRDVDLISTPNTYINDYWVRLERGSMSRVLADIELNGSESANKEVILTIQGREGKPIIKRIKTNAEGKASIAFDAKLALWSPESPSLYDITIANGEEVITDRIGFRCFEVRGTELYLNDEKIFLRGVNIHEEIPHDRRRAVNAEDAKFLLDAVIELGCNYLRYAHIPPTEHMARMCDELGIITWEEIPAWGNMLAYDNPEVCDLMTQMMDEMIQRDKNRCNVCIWSVANETKATDKARNTYLEDLVKKCREWDNTRAISAASNCSYLDKENPLKLVLKDPLADHLDIVGVNKYLGWYGNWGGDPAKTEWIARADKPLLVTEFGAGVVYANYGDANNSSSWSEGYGEQLYKDYVKFFANIPNLCGVTPWVMFDFRSPTRPNLRHQQGWNRKGLLSEFGEKKQIWYVMHDYYKRKSGK
ncbi:MAG: glycoside hydrolase family 2 TIM barrel-domain containing protein [Rikenellaceae bacterium]